jgi:hypothetical protein
MSSELEERRNHLYEYFGRAKFSYSPGAMTIEARKRMLEYLLIIRVGWKTTYY